MIKKSIFSVFLLTVFLYGTWYFSRNHFQSNSESKKNEIDTPIENIISEENKRDSVHLKLPPVPEQKQNDNGFQQKLEEDNFFKFSRDQGPDIHLQDHEGNLMITQITVVGDTVITHGDIIIQEFTDPEEIKRIVDSGKPLILPVPQLWENNTIHFEVGKSFDVADEIMTAVNYVSKKTNVKWIPRDGNVTIKDYVEFVKDDSVCCSYWGRLGGRQSIKLSAACGTGQIIHEMFHAMGLLHEQNREDRDNYIEILWENIEPQYHLQFQKIKNDLIDLKKYPFELSSIMMYGDNAFSMDPLAYNTIESLKGEDYYPNQNRPSKGDIEKINSLYKVQYRP